MFPIQVASLYKNEHEMIVIAKIFEKIVSTTNSGLSLRKLPFS